MNWQNASSRRPSRIPNRELRDKATLASQADWTRCHSCRLMKPYWETRAYCPSLTPRFTHLFSKCLTSASQPSTSQCMTLHSGGVSSVDKISFKTHLESTRRRLNGSTEPWLTMNSDSRGRSLTLSKGFWWWRTLRIRRTNLSILLNQARTFHRWCLLMRSKRALKADWTSLSPLHLRSLVRDSRMVNTFRSRRT